MALSWLLTNACAGLLLPPTNCFLLAGAGWLSLRRCPRLGKGLIVLAVILLWGLSLHAVSAALSRPLEERYPAWDGKSAADAVIVLGGGRNRQAPEFFGKDDLKWLSLERLRYGAILARQLNKPLLLTGGQPEGAGVSEAEAMQHALQRDFGLTAKWVEGQSDNTYENALFSARLLKAAGVEKVMLVTHALHMPRAMQVFAASGLQVVPVPIGFVSGRPLTPLDFLPRAESLSESSRALHEWVGLLWYALRH